MKKPFVHPYIPNSIPEVKEQMLREVGIKSVDEIYAEIPERLRLKRRLDLPAPILSECRLRQHVEKLLSKNKHCKEYVSFLGGGVYQHYVPSVVTTIMERDEFLTSYSGDAIADHGKFQAQFEYASCIAELVDMEMVITPTYDWGMAASIGVRMASRITGRAQALAAGSVSPDRIACMKNYAYSVVPSISFVDMDPKTGLLDLQDLRKKMTDKVACFYFESPAYLGFIETQGKEISGIVHDAGGVLVVGVDPISLGVLEPPARYGADIVVGDVQGLGIPLQWGGGQGGFVATRDEPLYVAELPSMLIGITKTTEPGEYGFGWVYFERTSHASREKGKDFMGTMSTLSGIGAGVYLSLMGPQGMRELAEGILQRSAYAMRTLSRIRGIRVPAFSAPHFKEFVVDFNGTGRTVAEINKALLEKKIFGGKDLSGEFSDRGQCALYCVTEVHTKEDLDSLAEALGAIC